MEEGSISTLRYLRRIYSALFHISAASLVSCALGRLENWLSTDYSFLIKLMTQLKHFVPEFLVPGKNEGVGGEGTDLVCWLTVPFRRQAAEEKAIMPFWFNKKNLISQCRVSYKA